MNAAEKASAAAPSAIEEATRLLAETRARCAALGLTPLQFAELLLPEALLAMMVGGMLQEDVEETFARFAREEIAAWFLQVKKTAGYCDCEREARAEHAVSCALSGSPVRRQILDAIEGDPGAQPTR